MSQEAQAAQVGETKPAKEKDRRLALIGKNIRFRRSLVGISQSELADKASVDRSLVTRLENGGKNMSLEVLLKIADALHCTPGFLMEGLGRK